MLFVMEGHADHHGVALFERDRETDPLEYFIVILVLKKGVLRDSLPVESLLDTVL